MAWGPTNDKCQAKDLIAKAQQVAMPDTLCADAGYDSESIHAQCREGWGSESVIKPAVHRAAGRRNCGGNVIQRVETHDGIDADLAQSRPPAQRKRSPSAGLHIRR